MYEVVKERVRNVTVDREGLRQLDVFYPEPALLGALVPVRQVQRHGKDNVRLPNVRFLIFQSNRKRYNE